MWPSLLTTHTHFPNIRRENCSLLSICLVNFSSEMSVCEISTSFQPLLFALRDCDCGNQEVLQSETSKNTWCGLLSFGRSRTLIPYKSIMWCIWDHFVLINVILLCKHCSLHLSLSLARSAWESIESWREKLPVNCLLFSSPPGV